jgi:hypothetical protein
LFAEFIETLMPPVTFTVGVLPNPAPDIVTVVLVPATPMLGEIPVTEGDTEIFGNAL